MKANPSARNLVRIQAILGCAVLVALVGLELFVGQFLTARLGQTGSLAAPTASISDLILSAR